jgi:hypothetical protein
MSGDVVEFECAVGAGRARWSGAPPRVGAHADVELDLDADVKLEPCDEAPSLRLDHGDTLLVAAVERLEDDDAVVLRLSPDGLLLHHPDVPLGEGTKGVRARLAANALCLTPFLL